MYVPEVFHSLCSRRLLVTEWIDGVKLSDCAPAKIRELIPDAQEAFLTQLLQASEGLPSPLLPPPSSL